MSVKLTTRQVGDVTVIDVAGRITLGEGSSALRDNLRELVKENHKNILLNLKEVTYIDSSGIGELVRNYMTVIKSGGTMKVVGLSAKVEDILKITQLHKVFPEFPDEEAALKSFPQSSDKSSQS